MFTTNSLTLAEVKGDRDWSLLEQDLLDACALGRPAYLPGREDLPTDQSDQDRRVRPELIRYLMLGGCDKGHRPHAKGVQLMGAWIDGKLDLVAVLSPLGLCMENCLFEQQVFLRDAEIGALYLPGCRAKQGLGLHRLNCRGSVFLRQGFHATGLVDLGGSKIGGALDCAAGRFDNIGGRALNCIGAQIGGAVFLRDGFAAKGEVSFIGASIAGQLACPRGRFDNATGLALSCHATQIGADVFLRDGFTTKGEVNFAGASIAGNLQISKARLDGALDLEAAKIGASLM